jgi:hypothetical protein
MTYGTRRGVEYGRSPLAFQVSECTNGGEFHVSQTISQF